MSSAAGARWPAIRSRAGGIRLVCRNKVADFEEWKSMFDSHAQAHREAGLELVDLWRGVDERDQMLFVFMVSDTARAKEFISAPEAKESGKQSGVLDGDYWFVE